MKVKEAKRHHYIPQFILKNFCFDTSNNVMYYDCENRIVSIKNTKEIFMEDDLYRDELNSTKDPVLLEKSFSKYESEVSIILKKFLVNNEIEVTKKEYESLQLFLAIMGLRSVNVKKDYKEDKNNNLDLFKQNNYNGSLVDLWKRNLQFLVDCRSLKEVLSHKEIDKIFKDFMQRDIFGLTGKYIVVFEKRGSEDLCIGDVYPCCVRGEPNPTLGINELPVYDFFPISPNRVLVLVSNGVVYMPDRLKIFKNSNLKPPILLDNKKLKFVVTRIYEEEVVKINELILEHSRKGVAFKNEESFISLPIEIE